MPNAHSIFEIVVHLDAWITFFSGAVEGTPIPPWPTMPMELDWPPVNVNDDEAWRESVRSLLANHLQFAERIEQFGDERLEETVPGRRYNFSQLFQSASLHAAYHAGQIALLKKMLA
ncbi:MAG TPA: DinB family protein [Gemmatimonadaceae bacterium]